MSEAVEKGYDCLGIFDSHAHYFDRRFEAETEGADSILKEQVFGNGIVGVINVATNNDNSRKCIAQARQYEGMYATVGIHPEDAAYSEATPEQELSGLAAFVDTPQKIKESKIVAIGEIGLDYHYEGYDKQLQAYFFEEQLKLAERVDLPVIIHDRDAHGDCFETVLKYPNVRGVFHSFSGSPEMAAELVKRGWYISFSGVLTFKNARKTVEAAERIPIERILIETDSPYLAPHPHRGKINHSGLMRLTAQRLADIKGISIEEAVAATRQNVTDLFGI